MSDQISNVSTLKLSKKISTKSRYCDIFRQAYALQVKYLGRKLFRRELLPMTTYLLTLHDRYITLRGFGEAHVAYELGIKITCPVAPLGLTIDGRKSTTVSLFMHRDAATATSRRKLSGRAISLRQQIVARMGKGGGHMTRFPRISLHATSLGESPTFAHPFSSPRQTFFRPEAIVLSPIRVRSYLCTIA